MLKPRNYRYKGVNPGKENKRFWLMLIIALAIVAALYYLLD